jgi:hypothetical protein
MVWTNEKQKAQANVPVDVPNPSIKIQKKKCRKIQKNNGKLCIGSLHKKCPFFQEIRKEIF